MSFAWNGSGAPGAMRAGRARKRRPRSGCCAGGCIHSWRNGRTTRLTPMRQPWPGLGQRRLAEERRLLARAAPEAVPAEAWSVNTPPAGDEVASIIILCCNEADYTRQCLESVVRHTRRPYELILVDNGSTDGTAEYLQF